MKVMTLALAFVSAIFIHSAAQAAVTGECAGSQAEIDNIESLMQLINPWGTWEGSADGKNAVVKLSKDPNGKFMALVNLDGKVMGPYNVSVCDYGDSYSLKLFFYEVPFEVVSSKKIKIYFKVGNSDHVIVRKTSNKTTKLWK